MNPLREALVRWAREQGYPIAFSRPAILDLARAEIEGRNRAGEFEPGFYRTVLAEAFSYPEDVELPRVTSVIVLAVPRPAHRLTFHLGGGPFQAVVPPTYASYSEVPEVIRGEILAGPLRGGYGLRTLWAPLKNIAARLGLAAYGRNNITYAPGFGSYHQLVCFVTEADLVSGAADPLKGTPGGAAASSPALMCPECAGCDACSRACPAGAIGHDRFLLHTERCLTFMNEHHVPWPDWLPASAHNAIIGCLVCQRACPLNRGLLRYEDLEPAFTLEETAALLAGADGGGPLWRAVEEKSDALGLPGLEDVAPRNLSALLLAPGPEGGGALRVEADSRVAADSRVRTGGRVSADSLEGGGIGE